MTDANRKRIYDALLGKIPEDLEGFPLKMLQEAARMDLEEIEPIIDEIVLNAIRGTFVHGSAGVPDGRGGYIWSDCKCGARLAGSEECYQRHVENAITRPN